MSQLNNEEINENIEENKIEQNEIEVNENKEKIKTEAINSANESKMSNKKKIIIFLLVFTMIAVTATITAIIYTNAQAKELKIEKNAEIVPDGLGVKSLRERYNANDLEIIGAREGRGYRQPKYEYDTNYNKVNINFIVIEGLLNKNIENKINNEIRKKAYSLFTNEELNDNDIDSIYISTQVNGNFGNIISMQMHKSVQYKEGVAKESIYGYDNWIGLTYDLTTGNEINFTDVFTNTTSIKNILTQSIYDSLIDKYVIMTDLTTDATYSDLSKIESESVVLLNECVRNFDDINFSLDERYIYIIVNKQNIVIEMPDFYSDIAIYNRFLKKNENIFDGTYKGSKDLFVFSTLDINREISDNTQKFLMVEDVYDNLRVEVEVDCYNTLYEKPEGKELYESYVSKVKNKIDALKKEAKANQDKAIVYTVNCYIAGMEYQNLTEMGINNYFVSPSYYEKTFRMSKKYYEETFYDKIVEVKRDGGLIFYYYEEDDNNITIEENEERNEYYDIYTNKTYKQLEGMEQIKQQIEYLKLYKENINVKVENMNWESDLYVFESIINHAKTECELTDEDIKKAIDLISEIREEGKKLREEIEKKEKEELEVIETTPTPVVEPEETLKPTDVPTPTILETPIPTARPTATANPTPTITPTLTPTATVTPVNTPILKPTDTVMPTMEVE